VTPKREYRSALRARQAGETRARIVEAARELFAAHGYAPTTLRAIAARAEVSPETVQAHGPKAALLRAAIEVAGFGVEGLDNVTDQERAQLLFSLDRDQLPEAIAGLLLAIHAPGAGVYRAMVEASAGDPDVAEYYADIVASIRRQWTAVWEVGLERGWVDASRPVGQAVDAWCLIASHEAYIRLVDDYGWTALQYTDWIAENFRTVLGQH
jgi:AcrR family transcriptional regulator